MSKFVKFTKNNDVVLNSEDEIFFSTLKTGTTVMMCGLDILEDEHSYLCDVHIIIIDSMTDIKLKLSWNVIEAGVIQEMMIRDLEDLQFLH